MADENSGLIDDAFLSFDLLCQIGDGRFEGRTFSGDDFGHALPQD
jgi:hypothetical protein